MPETQERDRAIHKRSMGGAVIGGRFKQTLRRPALQLQDHLKIAYSKVVDALHQCLELSTDIHFLCLLLFCE